jgi:hypothetical protein
MPELVPGTEREEPPAPEDGAPMPDGDEEPAVEDDVEPEVSAASEFFRAAEWRGYG